MTRYFLTLIIAFATIMSAGAQSFTDNLQRKQQGKGNVSVKQSSEIDALVNGKKNAPKTKEQLKAEKKAAKKAEREARKREKEARKAEKEARKKGIVVTKETNVIPQKPVVVMPALPEERVVVKKAPDLSQVIRTTTKLVRRVKIGPDGKPVTHKEVRAVRYKGMKKTAGYRIQVYFGGNKREDKNEAERIGHKVKAAFPDQPVYVHFYSPRWACRIGNFEKREEAEDLLKDMRKAGFRQAVIIECRVNVRDYQIID